MHNFPVIVAVGEPEKICHFRQFFRGRSGKLPAIEGGRPGHVAKRFAVLPKHRRSIVLRIEANGQQPDAFRQLRFLFRFRVNFSEIVGNQRAVVREWAPRIDERNQQHMSAKRIQVNALVVLIDDHKIRHRIAGPRNMKLRSRLAACLLRHHNIFQVRAAVVFVHHYVGGDFIARLEAVQVAGV
jgi:hypothetical protein